MAAMIASGFPERSFNGHSGAGRCAVSSPSDLLYGQALRIQRSPWREAKKCGVSARRINQSLGTAGKVWQEESFDRIVRDQREYDEKLDYMWNNPIRKGLVSPGEEYPYYIYPPKE